MIGDQIDYALDVPDGGDAMRWSPDAAALRAAWDTPESLSSQISRAADPAISWERAWLTFYDHWPSDLPWPARFVLATLAANPGCPARLVATLGARCFGVTIRAAAAANPTCPDGVRARLARDRSPRVRRAATEGAPTHGDH